MVYEQRNSKGDRYFLHSNGHMFWFSKNRDERAIDMPEGYKVGENERTGLLFLKKK